VLPAISMEVADMASTQVSRSDTSPSLCSQTISLAELADALGIGMTAAYDAAQRNDLPVPVIRVGRQYRFSKQALERILTAQHEPAR